MNVQQQRRVILSAAVSVYHSGCLAKSREIAVHSVTSTGPCRDVMFSHWSCRRLLVQPVQPLPAFKPCALTAGMSKTIRKIISTAKAAPPVSAYSQAVCVNNMVYVSGTIGIDKDTKKLASDGIVGQARAAFTNLGNILEAAGSSFSKVVKVTILLDDINDFAAVGDIYKEFFKEPYPARISYQAAKLPLMAKIEVDAIAVAGEVETIQ